jgi:hypothetical protein
LDSLLEILGERDTWAERLDDDDEEIDLVVVLVRELVCDEVEVLVSVFVSEEAVVDDTVNDNRDEELGDLEELEDDVIADDTEGDRDNLAEGESVAELASLIVAKTLSNTMLEEEVAETFVLAVTLKLTLGEVETLRLRDSCDEADGERDDRGEAVDVRETQVDAEYVPLELLAFEIVEETVFETDTTLEVDRLGSSVDSPSKLGEEVPELDVERRLDALAERDTRAERLDDIAGEIVEISVLVNVSENAGVSVTEPVSVIDEVADVEALRETRAERLEVLVKQGEDVATEDNEGEGDTLAEDDNLVDLVSLDVTEALRDAIRLTDTVTEKDMETLPLVVTLGDVETLRLRDSFGEAEGELEDRTEALVVREELEDAELVPLELCLCENEDDAVDEAVAALDLDTLDESVEVSDTVGEEGAVMDKVPRLVALGEPDARAEGIGSDEEEGDLVVALVRELVRDNDADLVPVFDFEEVPVDEPLEEN